MIFLRNLFLHSPKRYIIALILVTVFLLIILFTRGTEYALTYVDAFSVSGALVLLMGFFQMLSFYGAMDFLSYSFSGFRHESKYKDLYSYRKMKDEKRARSKLTYMPFVTVGAFFLIIGLILNAVLL